MSDRRERLEDIRDQLTAAMGSAEPSVMAQLAGQLRQTLKELDELDDGAGGSTADDIADRVRLRLAHTNASPAAARGA
jgi:hypothetical protein